MQELIFGKDNTKNIVSCEVSENNIELFLEQNGNITSKFIPNTFWILSSRKLDSFFKPLKGDNFYKYIKTYTNIGYYYKDRKKFKEQDIFTVADQKEAAMIYNGFTYFKGLKVSDISVLAFDIESTGLQHTKDSRVLIISNTFRSQGKIIKKMFSCDEYESDADMFSDWCQWVRKMNPSVMLGHNIYGYDLSYMKFCSEKVGVTLALGRDGSDLKINNYPSKFRKDGSQEYEYFRSTIYGREIIDTMFVSYHYDFSRKYVSYALKQIIKQEGLEIKDRQFYDAGNISKNWNNLEERRKIKLYAEHDSDDALALYDLMINSFFYLTSSVPKSFAAINYTASGSQLNSFLVRSYLQENYSIPKADEVARFEGAISFGNCGRYKNVYKVDVASLYPSIMLEYNVYDKKKDPLGNFQKMVSYFTTERLNNKRLAKETSEQYYKDLEQMGKIFINSAYGLLGAPGLHFNSPLNGAFVTRIGREVLQKAIEWTQQYDFTVVNGDTDSISLCFDDMSVMTQDERFRILEELNSLFPNRIKWEDDGYYKGVLILKAKNYVLWGEDDKLKIKGSALKATNKELALKEFIQHTVKNLLEDKINDIKEEYDNLILEIFNLKDINRWVSKKTITEKVLNAERTTEQKILNAVDENEVQMGDKLYFYFTVDDSLKLSYNWTNDHSTDRLCEKLFKTLNLFNDILDVISFKNYKLKRNKKDLQELLCRNLIISPEKNLEVG